MPAIRQTLVLTGLLAAVPALAQQAESCLQDAPADAVEALPDGGEAHLDDRLALADLARVACLSPYHFSRSCKQAVGMGPQRFVMYRRVERAKFLMRRTDQPLAVIAQEVGFADQSHLTSVFRREIGVTPGHFRSALT